MNLDRWRLAAAAGAVLFAFTAASGRPAPLKLEAKIPLGDVRGRIDHLAFDLSRHRLFVAELGDNSVGVVDVQERKLRRRLTGMKEPQGLGYEPSSDTLYVANAADGSVRLFRGAELAPLGKISLGEDADNIRVDGSGHSVFVGYGSGSLAVIDATSRTKVADIPLKAHPEAFQLESSGPRVFINVPDAREIAVVDRTTAKQIATWSTDDLRANFPMALDAELARVLVVFRHPERVGVFSAADGRRLAALDTCADSDDLYVDSKRRRLYVICGEGFVDVFAKQGESYLRLARVPTAKGARTGLYIPEADRLFVAVRATSAEAAAVWAFRPED